MTFHRALSLQTLCLISFVSTVTCGSVAVFGNRGGGQGKTSENWAVLSPGTQIFLLILGVILGLFGLYGFYRLVRWCGINPRKNNAHQNNQH